MMIKSSFVAAALVATMASVPAAAVTVVANFGGTTGNVSSVVLTNIAGSGLTLTATSRQYFVAPGPGALTNLSQTTASGQIRRTAPGIGVNGGASNDQIDTNQPGTVQAPLREAILITGNQDFSLSGLRLSFVDNDDTLKVFGVLSTGALVDLGYGTTATSAGTIVGGLNGAASGLVFNSGLNSGTASFGLAPTTYFTRYLFTTRVGGDVSFLGTLGQGYRLDALTATVPEPGTWAMLIIGFGMVGVAARRRNTAARA
jgi:hypothetical protein